MPLSPQVQILRTNRSRRKYSRQMLAGRNAEHIRACVGGKDHRFKMSLQLTGHL
jgi:hypothetical protein